jgi:hypothetical protein
VSEFYGSNVNEVLRLVKSMSKDGDTQLSILTVALVTACRSCRVPEEETLRQVQAAFADPRPLVHLEH